VKRGPSPPALGEQSTQRDAFGIKMIRSTVETLRTRFEQVSSLDVDDGGVNSLHEIGGSTPTTPLNRLHRTWIRNSPPLQVGEQYTRAKAFGIEMIRSAVGAPPAVIERALRGDVDNAEATSLHELGGATTVSVSGQLHRTANANLSRRNVIRTAGYAATAGAFGAAVQATAAISDHVGRERETTVSDRETAVSYEVDREQQTILDGTQYETIIYTITSPTDGPTVMIFGGVHGNELGGLEAAHLATNYTIDRGTLVVSPETNKAAVELERNHGPDGDLNRQFPVDGEPTTEVARGVWDELLRVDPAFLIDMHTATTLMSRGSVGQGIFPTSGTVDYAENAAAAVNEDYLDERTTGDLPEHAFQVGNVVTEDRPRLNHKAAANQNIEGWSTEVTRIGLTVDEKTFLHDMLTRELLRQIGINVVSDLEMTNPL
jgi:predicted deacylase